MSLLHTAEQVQLTAREEHTLPRPAGQVLAHCSHVVQVCRSNCLVGSLACCSRVCALAENISNTRKRLLRGRCNHATTNSGVQNNRGQYPPAGHLEACSDRGQGDEVVQLLVAGQACLGSAPALYGLQQVRCDDPDIPRSQLVVDGRPVKSACHLLQWQRR